MSVEEVGVGGGGSGYGGSCGSCVLLAVQAFAMIAKLMVGVEMVAGGSGACKKQVASRVGGSGDCSSAFEQSVALEASATKESLIAMMTQREKPEVLDAMADTLESSAT